jgi:hypothetical protein
MEVCLPKCRTELEPGKGGEGKNSSFVKLNKKVASLLLLFAAELPALTSGYKESCMRQLRKEESVRCDTYF